MPLNQSRVHATSWDFTAWNKSSISIAETRPVLAGNAEPNQSGRCPETTIPDVDVSAGLAQDVGRDSDGREMLRGATLLLPLRSRCLRDTDHPQAPPVRLPDRLLGEEIIMAIHAAILGYTRLAFEWLESAASISLVTLRGASPKLERETFCSERTLPRKPLPAKPRPTGQRMPVR